MTHSYSKRIFLGVLGGGGLEKLGKPALQKEYWEEDKFALNLLKYIKKSWLAYEEWV